MEAFLTKSQKTVQEIQKAMDRQQIWRRAHEVDESFPAALRAAFTWSRTPRTRLLLFLRAMNFHVTGEKVTLTSPPNSNAVECVRECGTPVRLLQAYYKRLGLKLVLMSGIWWTLAEAPHASRVITRTFKPQIFSQKSVSTVSGR